MTEQDQELNKQILLLRDMARTHFDLVFTDRQTEQFAAYTRILLEWNERMNLTAITDPAEVMVKHHLDSLAFVKWLNRNKSSDPILLADIGTGAGFPGIPIKILMPELHVLLVDALAKRISFLDHVISELALSKISTCHARAEDIARDGKHREKYDITVARAVAELPILLEYCTPLLKVGGRFIAAKGLDPEKEIESAGNALKVLNCTVEDYTKYQLAAGVDYRSLIFIKKTGPTPAKYPRQAGKPKKNPL